ncbi:hypothetical protein, partial [Nocardioides sp.]|uniref:hypothetical protein n=1 Tax=Nocardioides sp. TaxID=35761 RepID=UPI003A5C39F5
QGLAEPPAEVTVGDDTGALSVTVPTSWDEARSTVSWMPPNVGEGRELPALSVGTSADWAALAGAEGVFVGVLPGTELPDQVPQHLECSTATDPVFSVDGDTVTVFYSDCPLDTLVVERVVQVNRSQLMWVQIRSDDRPTANRVLSAVRALGLS